MRNLSFLKFTIWGIGLLLFSSCGEEKEKVVMESIRPVKYGKVTISSEAQTETFSGAAQSSKESKMSFKVEGIITRLNIKVGDVLRKGQLVAKIDHTDFDVQLQQSVANSKNSETQIQSSKSQLVNSRANYQRIETLYENNSVSASEFEQAKSDLELAEASYNAAIAQANASEKQVESAQNQVNYSTLVAPFQGVITSVDVEENELVSSGTTIATLSAMSHPEISVGIPEVHIAKIRKSQPVEVVFSALPNETFSGRVYEVGFSSLGGSTYPVTIRVDQSEEVIRPGMVADVRFNFGKGSYQKMFVPASAVGEDNNGRFVFGIEKKGQLYFAKKKPVSIGALTTAGFEIEAGLNDGELVATAGLNTLLDGVKVRLME